MRSHTFLLPLVQANKITNALALVRGMNDTSRHVLDREFLLTNPAYKPLVLVCAWCQKFNAISTSSAILAVASCTPTVPIVLVCTMHSASCPVGLQASSGRVCATCLNSGLAHHGCRKSTHRHLAGLILT